MVESSSTRFLKTDFMFREQTKFFLLKFPNSGATISELTSAQISQNALRIGFKLLSLGLVS